MSLKHCLTWIPVVFLTVSGWSQTTVNLTNGHVKEGRLVSTADDQVHIKETSKKGKVFDSYYENYRVFSIIDSSGSETILYKQDSAIGNFLSPPDMKFYMLGEQDAYKNYRPLGTMIIGTGLGIGFGLLDTYGFGDPNDATVPIGFFKSDPGFLTLIYPFAYTVVAGILPRPQLDIHNITDRNNLNSEHFIQGFARVARFKRLIRALISSAAGSAIGLGTYLIFK